ncbi:hypothetical protein BT96DRAFT_874125 [Gymnopus androsaceus JB14]|uniref:Uncharacterized protein n=1 Tax=Gymnopus androsaceus JB14 TaxID=1447944 RepID=A0A6A4I7F3_9AGAR|nr:hypothetical protein BT96DRAFT_874125 [Gymnopus androsaceus JB14]
MAATHSLIPCQQFGARAGYYESVFHHLMYILVKIGCFCLMDVLLARYWYLWSKLN